MAGGIGIQNPNLEGSRRLSLKQGRSRLRWVSQLMLQGRREWDVPMLHILLYTHDVNEVLKIRLSDGAPDDHVAWMHEKSGIFSVRLAARLEALEQNQTGSSSHVEGDRPVYRAIWSSEVSPKVKIF
jgi:hypothetical protein